MNSESNQTTIAIDIENLPSVPHTLVKLIDAFHDTDVDFKRIAKIIQQDPTLTSKMLEVANSAHYAQYQFKNFEQLLIVLGMDSVKTIATTAAVQQFFSQFNNDSDGLVACFWLKSLRAAYFSKAIAKLVTYPNIDEAYLGGLIHQMGQLVMLSQHYSEYGELWGKSKTSLHLLENEMQLFGYSSAELGAKLSQSWGMNTLLDDAILYQNASVEQLFDSPLLVQIINLAHKFCQQSDSSKDEFKEQVYQLFGLTHGLIEDLCNSIEDEVLTAAKSLDIVLNENKTKINNSEKYSLYLASRVKNIAIAATTGATSATTTEIPIESRHQEDKLEQVILKLMQNIHLVFGLSQSLFFSYNQAQQELFCSLKNVSSKDDLEPFKIKTHPQRSLLARAYNKQIISSSFEIKDNTTVSIVDQQLLRILNGEGILSIPLFDKEDFFGLLVLGLTHKQYSLLLEQRLLLAEFTRAAVRNFKQLKNHQQQLEKANKDKNLQIRKLIHEANNPLTIMTNYLKILSVKMHSSHEDIAPQIKVLEQEVERVAQILLQMREPFDETHGIPYSSTMNVMENINVNLLIKELISVFKNSLFETNQVLEVLQLDENIPTIECDRNGLKQILINLIKNAVEAMPDGGVIEIETHDVVNLDAQQYIELSISDTGKGIKEELISKLFMPVNSSKNNNHAGLGLTIVKNILDNLGGVISYHKQQSGAKFVILLPRKITT